MPSPEISIIEFNLSEWFYLWDGFLDEKTWSDICARWMLLLLGNP